MSTMKAPKIGDQRAQLLEGAELRSGVEIGAAPSRQIANFNCNVDPAVSAVDDRRADRERKRFVPLAEPSLSVGPLWCARVLAKSEREFSQPAGYGFTAKLPRACQPSSGSLPST